MGLDTKYEIKFNMRLGFPTQSGRVYTEESIVKAIKKFKEGKKPLTIEDPQAHGTFWVAGVEDIRIEDRSVFATIAFVDSPPGRHVKSIIESNSHAVGFSPTMKGDQMVSIGVNYNPIDTHSISEDTCEAIEIISATLSVRAKELGLDMEFGVDSSRLYVDYSTPDIDGNAGSWLRYDSKNKVVALGLDKASIYDPSGVDKFIKILAKRQPRWS